jgi:tetratricopeptide (TPR) repeat protein
MRQWQKVQETLLPKHEAEERDRAAEQQAEREERDAAHRASLREAQARMLAGVEDDLDELTAASNAAVGLVHAGKLDEAERAARDLLERFPDVHDGWDRLGMVYEARGDNQKAADGYRKVVEFIRVHPDDYDDGFAEVLVKLVEKLDPAAR